MVCVLDLWICLRDRSDVIHQVDLDTMELPACHDGNSVLLSQPAAQPSSSHRPRPHSLRLLRYA